MWNIPKAADVISSEVQKTSRYLVVGLTDGPGKGTGNCVLAVEYGDANGKVESGVEEGQV